LAKIFNPHTVGNLEEILNFVQITQFCCKWIEIQVQNHVCGSAVWEIM